MLRYRTPVRILRETGTMIGKLSTEEVETLIQSPNMASLELKIPSKCLNTVSNQTIAVVNRSMAYLDLAGSREKDVLASEFADDDFRSIHKRTPERPNTSFKLFPKLPLETRQQIWSIVITDILPRCIKVVEKLTTDGVSDLVLCGAPCPPLLTTCKEVYDEVLATKTYRPMFRMINTSKSVYFNPKLDIIEFCVDHTRVIAGELQRPHPQLNFGQHLINPSDAAEGIQNVRIDGNILQFAEKWVVKNIDAMDNLKTFSIGGTFSFDRAISLPLQPIRFFFETIADGIFGHAYVTPFFFDEYGDYFRDLDAMERIRNEIQDIHERFRPYNMWHIMNRVVKETKKLPKIYEVQLHYTHDY